MNGNPAWALAIVGRPNVGKSTLYNRLVGGRDAVVNPQAGVTRDRKVGVASWGGQAFSVIDTGGWVPAGKTTGESPSDGRAAGSGSADGGHRGRSGGADPQLDAKVSAQSERAIGDADLVVFVVDVTTGVTETDAAYAKVLRRSGVPVALAVNKVDSDTRSADIWAFNRLGLGEPWAISALHGRGVADLLDHCCGVVVEGEPAGVDGSVDDAASDDVTSVAIVGRPNVGKSTLFNRLVGDDRSVVHDRAGTTRDSIDTVVETAVGTLRFVDTAGLRRKPKVDDNVEYYANVRALNSIEIADVALIVIDATIGVTHQDQRLAERVDVAGGAAVVLLNKWDVADAEQREAALESMARRLHFLGAAPVLRVSALTGRGTHKVLGALGEAMEAHAARVPTSAVNDAIAAAQAAQPAPHGARVLYATQGATHPPTFTLFANRELPATYLRYLERFLIDRFDLGRTPIKLRVRRR